MDMNPINILSVSWCLMVEYRLFCLSLQGTDIYTEDTWTEQTCFFFLSMITHTHENGRDKINGGEKQIVP